MNFQTTILKPPLRVMLINPLIPASQLISTKILTGTVFGRSQLIDLILLVYANEINLAEGFAQELIACAFSCYNSIRVTSDLPCLSDADVFCFMTEFANPNAFDFNNMDSEEQFDNLYLIIKIATSFAKPISVKEEPIENSKKRSSDSRREPLKPVIIADGLLVLDILRTIAKNLPPEILFSSTPLRTIAKITLSDFLKVKCSELNRAYIWAASDTVFHAEIKVPFVKGDIVDKDTSDWDAISPGMLEKLNMENINFNVSWMKREFIERMVASAKNNPYGCISKAAEMSKTLCIIWKPRCIEDAIGSKTSLGVISDGSLGTIKGLPYVLPVKFKHKTTDTAQSNSDYSWSVHLKYEETPYLRQEIKKINAAALKHHQQLVPYCKKFLQENVIKMAFIPKWLASIDSVSECTNSYQDSTTTMVSEDTETI